MPLAAVEEKTAINLQHGHTVAMFCQISPKNLKLVFGPKMAHGRTILIYGKSIVFKHPQTENTAV